MKESKNKNIDKDNDKPLLPFLQRSRSPGELSTSSEYNSPKSSESEINSFATDNDKPLLPFRQRSRSPGELSTSSESTSSKYSVMEESEKKNLAKENHKPLLPFRLRSKSPEKLPTSSESTLSESSKTSKIINKITKTFSKYNSILLDDDQNKKDENKQFCNLTNKMSIKIDKTNNDNKLRFNNCSISTQTEEKTKESAPKINNRSVKSTINLTAIKSSLCINSLKNKDYDGSKKSKKLNSRKSRSHSKVKKSERRSEHSRSSRKTESRYKSDYKSSNSDRTNKKSSDNKRHSRSKSTRRSCKRKRSISKKYSRERSRKDRNLNEDILKRPLVSEFSKCNKLKNDSKSNKCCESININRSLKTNNQSNKYSIIEKNNAKSCCDSERHAHAKESSKSRKYGHSNKNDHVDNKNSKSRGLKNSPVKTTKKKIIEVNSCKCKKCISPGKNLEQKSESNSKRKEEITILNSSNRCKKIENNEKDNLTLKRHSNERDSKYNKYKSISKSIKPNSSKKIPYSKSYVPIPSGSISCSVINNYDIHKECFSCESKTANAYSPNLRQYSSMQNNTKSIITSQISHYEDSSIKCFDKTSYFRNQTEKLRCKNDNYLALSINNYTVYYNTFVPVVYYTNMPDYQSAFSNKGRFDNVLPQENVFTNSSDVTISDQLQIGFHHNPREIDIPQFSSLDNLNSKYNLQSGLNEIQHFSNEKRLNIFANDCYLTNADLPCNILSMSETLLSKTTNEKSSLINQPCEKNFESEMASPSDDEENNFTLQYNKEEILLGLPDYDEKILKLSPNEQKIIYTLQADELKSQPNNKITFQNTSLQLDNISYPLDSNCFITSKDINYHMLSSNFENTIPCITLKSEANSIADCKTLTSNYSEFNETNTTVCECYDALLNNCNISSNSNNTLNNISDKESNLKNQYLQLYEDSDELALSNIDYIDSSALCDYMPADEESSDTLDSSDENYRLLKDIIYQNSKTLTWEEIMDSVHQLELALDQPDNKDNFIDIRIDQRDILSNLKL